jgi:NADH-quinone oxidoreductase subunit H
MDAWDWVIVIVKSLAIMLLFLAAPLVLVLLERWTLGRLQSRIGPHRVGPHGMLQTVADGLKLGIKEDLIPAGSERLIFWMAPVPKI